MAKVRFYELSDDEPTPFDGLQICSPSGYNRFTNPSLESLGLTKPDSVTGSTPTAPEGSTTTPDASTGEDGKVP